MTVWAWFAIMVGRVLMVSTHTTVTAIQVFMDATVTLTIMSVHRRLAEMVAYVQMVSPSIIVSANPVLQVCVSSGITCCLNSFKMV